MKIDISEVEKHYGESKSRYNVPGESHLEYYGEKFPENYELLKKAYSDKVF